MRRPTPGPIETADAARNEVIARYTAAEFELYRSKTNRAEDFARHSAFWREIANDDGTVNSAYGYLIWAKPLSGCRRTAWEWAVEALMRDRDTRQAFVRFSWPEHQFFGNRDVPCTMHANFAIRADRLHMDVVMRSNDVVRGLVYDMPWFCHLLDLMSATVGVAKGEYTHFAHSMHLYERDRATAEGMV